MPVIVKSCRVGLVIISVVLGYCIAEMYIHKTTQR